MIDISGAYLKADKTDVTGEEVHAIFDKVGSALLCIIDGEYNIVGTGCTNFGPLFFWGIFLCRTG